MAHRKAGGTADNLKDSNPKYLGTKKYAGEKVKSGDILVRQRGTKILAGTSVRIGKDHTLYSIGSGTVKFTNARKTSYDGRTKVLKKVHVV